MFATHASFSIDVGKMGLDRFWRHDQLLGDAGPAVTVKRFNQNLAFAGGQLRTLAEGVDLARESVAGRRRIEVLAAGC